MTNANLYAEIAAAALGRDEALLLRTPQGRRIHYGELDVLTGQIAGALHRAGVKRNDRVAAQLEKSPEALLLYLACLRAGVVYLPLNPAYSDAELDFFFADAGPRLIVCDPARRSGIAELAGAAGAAIHTLDAAGQGTLFDLARTAAANAPPAAVTGEDPAAICYTSGTTGRPKGAVLSHRNLSSNAWTLKRVWGFGAADLLLHALPLYHVHGLFVAVNTLLLAGGGLLFLERFDAEEVIATLPEATAMMGVPTFYTRILAHPRLTRSDVAHMRLFVSGSAPLLEETFAAFEARTGHRILERYGMTETGMICSNPLSGERRPGTVGPPLPDVEVRVRGEEGALCKAGEIGVLEVKGPNVFRGYWRLPERSLEDFTKDGFFKTGDLATIEEDGYVRIVGRGKDLIITGGLNVYPKEVESVIDRLAGVGESAVIGIPHPDLGEAVVAVVTRSGTEPLDEEAVIAAARRTLAGFKVPKRVVFVASLPRNTMGKVQKALLRGEHRRIFEA